MPSNGAPLQTKRPLRLRGLESPPPPPPATAFFPAVVDQARVVACFRGIFYHQR
jgi:hypothetical protein